MENLIQLIGIESPGLTAALPIAKMVEEMVFSRLRLAQKSGWRAEYRGIERFCELSDEEKAARIAENPDYGEIVCRCETVTKAEIRQAIENPLGARSIVSIKNRVRATMGRCSGGYCLTRIMNILHFEYGVPYELIDLRRAGDHPFTGVVK